MLSHAHGHSHGQLDKHASPSMVSPTPARHSDGGSVDSGDGGRGGVAASRSTVRAPVPSSTATRASMASVAAARPRPRLRPTVSSNQSPRPRDLMPSAVRSSESLSSRLSPWLPSAHAEESDRSPVSSTASVSPLVPSSRRRTDAATDGYHGAGGDGMSADASDAAPNATSSDEGERGGAGAEQEHTDDEWVGRMLQAQPPGTHTSQFANRAIAAAAPLLANVVEGGSAAPVDQISGISDFGKPCPIRVCVRVRPFAGYGSAIIYPLRLRLKM
jgi:hypothetical protein